MSRTVSILCPCGASVPVGKRGPLPVYCDPCRHLRGLLDLVRAVKGTELGTEDAWAAARILGAAAERLRARHER